MSDSSKTVVVLGGRQQRPALTVEYPGSDGRPCVESFIDRLVIGRDPKCDIQLQNEGVSRRHFEFFPEQGKWWLKDLGSSNGTFLNGSRIEHAPLPPTSKIEFFAGGPVVHTSWNPIETAPNRKRHQPGPQRRVASRQSSARGAVRSGRQQKTGVEPSPNEPSQLERLARSHRKRFVIGMTMMALLLTAALGVIVYQHRDQGDVKKLAKEIFYQTKSLELELSRLKLELSKRPETKVPAKVKETTRRLRDMQQRYANFAEERELLGSHRSKEDLLIFRVARIFGEYDLSIPDDFVSEVKRYIRKWQQSKRLEKTMSRINARGQGQTVARALRRRDLPPQFLYLAVQESDFRTDAIGPVTRFGIPKGMWQFIPQTAAEYGLNIGPERERRIFDPQDDRFDFHKATEAAADYLRYLYTTDAQASGLLVMSAYNWGHGNLRRKLTRLPQRPEDRNFWRLLQTQQIPDETYGYVLNIVAAAVIGEDPAHFGFSFENPLQDL